MKFPRCSSLTLYILYRKKYPAPKSPYFLINFLNPAKKIHVKQNIIKAAKDRETNLEEITKDKTNRALKGSSDFSNVVFLI